MWSRPSKTISEPPTKTVSIVFMKGVTRESTLVDHGLDSLDAIELAMQLEEDLGYVISAETLSQFQKVKHYINYIEQVEGFKRDNNGQVPLPWFALLV